MKTFVEYLEHKTLKKYPECLLILTRKEIIEMADKWHNLEKSERVMKKFVLNVDVMFLNIKKDAQNITLADSFKFLWSERN